MNENNNNNNIIKESNIKKEELKIENDKITKNEELKSEDGNNIKDKGSEFETDSNLIEVNKDNSSSRILRISSRKKLDNFISLDTLVYDILGQGENRKNYDKISSEIKRIEHLDRIDKEKLRKKIRLMSKRLNEIKDSKIKELKESKNKDIDEKHVNFNNEKDQNKLVNLQMKKLEMMEYEKDKKYNYLEVIEIFKIPPEKRTIRDILRIKTYIDQSKLGLNFMEEFSEKNIAEKLIHFCCIEMRYKRFKKDELIIKIGDPPDFFYSIIFGKVKIVKPVPKIKSLTGFQYFKFLMDMRKQNENYIFTQCIRTNKNNFHIESNDGDTIRYIYLLNYLEHIKVNNEPKIELDKILNLLDIKPEELGIKPNLINSNFYIKKSLQNIRNKIPQISPDIMELYSFILDNIEKKEVTIFEYKKFLSLKTNDYFGDSGIQTNSPRNATIIAEEDTDIAYLSNKLYFAQIATQKAIILSIKIKNLYQNFFFNKINYYKFAEKYFTWFISEKYYKGDRIFNEGENIKYLYFIQEGSVELSISKSMNEIESLINKFILKKDILSIYNYMDNNLTKLRKIEIENDNSYKENNLYEYNQINSTYNDIIDILQQKQNNKIVILNNNEEIGIVSYFLGNNYLGTCEVISKMAKIYKIEIDYLDQLLEKEKDIKFDFYRRLKNKLNLYNDRLFQINNIKLVMTDKKITKKNLDIKKIEEKEIIPTNISINKTLINYDKINSFINEQKDTSDYNNNSHIKYHNKIRLKNEINLPKLNINRNRNFNFFSLPSLHNENDEFRNKHKVKRVNKLIKRNIHFNNIKLFKILNKNQKLSIEDNMISKIKKDFESFSQKKSELLKERINIDVNNDIDLIKKDIYYSPKRISNPIYLTEINNDSSNNVSISNKKKINERNNYNKDNFPPLSPSIIDKMLDISDRSISIESSQDNKKRINSNYKSISNDNNRLNTENNLIIYNERKNGILKGNNISLNKKYNHPYYDPFTLIKKEQYKIFDNNNINNSSNKDYINLHIKRIRELKKIRAYLKNNFRIRLKFNNINNKE